MYLMKNVFLLLLCSFFSACSMIDYDSLTNQQIKKLSLDDICSSITSAKEWGQDPHPKAIEEANRRGFTCDEAIDTCRHQMGLKQGTGDFANCVIGMNQLSAQRSAAQQAAIANINNSFYHQQMINSMNQPQNINIWHH